MDSKLSEALQRAAAELLQRKHFGSVEIRQVRAYLDAAREDEPTLRFELVVSSPSGSQGAWSTEDVFNLRSEVWALLAREGISLTPTVDLLPDNPESEDDADEDDLARALDADDRA
jgi:hypothetical protein